MRTIADVMLERIIDIAKEAGYKPTGNMLADMQTEYMLTKFAYRIEHELNVINEENPTNG